MVMQLRAIPAATGLVLLGLARLVVEQMTAAPDAPRQVPISIPAQEEIRQVEARINQIESESPRRVRESSTDPAADVTLLGKLILFDQNLSDNRNEACAFCHMPDQVSPVQLVL
jgi:cytochrome c peroxidase